MAMIAVQSVTARRAMASDCTVQTNRGIVKGQKKVSTAFSNREYYSFLGIPYAKPPVGNLRFKDPQPVDQWEGVLDCLADSEDCPQIHLIFRNFVGNEDCLRLNVFTPKLPSDASTPKPVMVWIHGGGFTFGSGSRECYGPDYLMEQDIVLVCINYRVGAFGFLTFGNDDVPGNAGLKDQSLALRWVQQNISAFGGDPKNVTLFGESAGSASVHYQMLSPLSRGLFQRAILQSGTCLNPWAFTKHGHERSFRLAEVLGFKTTDAKEAVEFLRKASVEDIVRNQSKVLTYKDKANLSFPFVPTTEVEGTGNNFLTKHPRTMLEEGDFAHIPVIIGLNTNEGLVVMNDLQHTPEYLQIINKDIGRVVHENIGVPADSWQATMDKIKKFYVGDKDISWDTIDGYLNYISDLLFTIGTDQTIRLQLEKANVPIYVYLLSYEGPRAMLKLLINAKYEDRPKLPGVAHADDLVYLFTQNLPGVEEIERGSLDERITSAFIKMWTEFAKSGNPNTPGIDTKWEASKKGGICYLDIGERLQMKRTRLYEERMTFWDSLLNFPLKQKL